MLLFAADFVEFGAAGFVFGDPFAGEFAVLDFAPEFRSWFWRVSSLMTCGPRGVIAVFGGVADGIAHVVEAALIDQVDDQFQFVQTFEIGDFGLIAGVDERVESRP